MTQQNGTQIIEPIEHFLKSVVCRDRLALYQRVIDLIKNSQRFSIIEQLNSILVAQINESGSELVGEIHECMINHLVELALEYDVVVAGADLPFLIDLLEALSLLDTYDAHEYIINTITSSEGTPVYGLFEVVNIIKQFDEQEFMDYVKMSSMSLLDRIREIHDAALTMIEDGEIVADETDFSLLKKVVAANSDLIINRLLGDFKISGRLDAKSITQIVKAEFESIPSDDPRAVAKELLGVYMVTGLKPPLLMDVIREEVPSLISDDLVIAKVNSVINAVYVEITT